jgi:hypothetical protein
MSTDRAVRERQRAYIVWSALETASDHITPGHPAELDIRRALLAAEEYWKALQAPQEDSLEATRADG